MPKPVDLKLQIFSYRKTRIDKTFWHGLGLQRLCSWKPVFRGQSYLDLVCRGVLGVERSLEAPSTGNPFSGTKLLGFSMGRGFGGRKELRSPVA